MKYYLKRLFSMDYTKMLKTVSKVHKRSGKNSILIFFDMIICSIKYKAGYVDYFIFCFDNLNAYQRSTFITRGINNEYIKKLNNREFYYKFDNKLEFNKIFKSYLKRDYLDLSNCSLDDFKKFTNKHNSFIVKPVDQFCGKGIEKININDTDITKLYYKLITNKQTLVEELVIQIDELNNLFPHSVNTLRIVTARVDKKTTVLFRSIRIGNGNNVVDNFNHGGMYSVISEDGIITKPAIDKNSIVYENHPVTNTEIVGFEIPYFKEAMEMVIKASELVEEIGLVGWDVAITKNGPLLIEGNQLPGYDIYQSKIHLNDDGTGLKPLFDKVIYKK